MIKAEEVEELEHNWCQWNWNVLERAVIESEDGESIRRLFIVVHNVPDDEVKEFVKDTWPSEHCQHSYDCCGRFYRRNARILTNSNGYMLVEQVATLNV